MSRERGLRRVDGSEAVRPITTASSTLQSVFVEPARDPDLVVRPDDRVRRFIEDQPVSTGGSDPDSAACAA